MLKARNVSATGALLQERETDDAALEIPHYLAPCLEYIKALELENLKLKRRMKKFKAGQGQSNAEPVNILKQKGVITSAELRAIIPISQSTMNRLIKEGRFRIQPIRTDRRSQWRSEDVLKLLRRLKGQEMGFYGTKDVCRLLGYQSDGGLHKAAKEGRIPPKIKLFGIVPAWVKEDIHAFLKGKWSI